MIFEARIVVTSWEIVRLAEGVFVTVELVRLIVSSVLLAVGDVGMIDTFSMDTDGMSRKVVEAAIDDFVSFVFDDDFSDVTNVEAVKVGGARAGADDDMESVSVDESIEVDGGFAVDE